ncbi:MAG: RNA polymerase sigma factor [Gammaproteobacteria bacterium]|nr:RNA polymerase sigma factor [Gammaproteobacteria bacterium]
MVSEADLRQQIVAVIPRMRRFARSLCGNTPDADDLVQVALEKALTRLHQFTPGTRLDSWLMRIVQTSFLDDRRKASRREEGLDEESLSRLPEARQDDDSERSSKVRDIDRALLQLPEEQRVLVGLVLVEGYSYREAAEIMAVPTGTVMSRLARARKALVMHLREEGYE